MNYVNTTMSLNYEDIKYKEIMNGLSQELKEELNMLCCHVGLQNFVIFQKFYFSNINKFSYVRALSNVAQYTKNYNNYIINFLDRHPHEFSNFHNYMFIESDNCVCYCNMDLIHIFIERYPQMMAKNLNDKGQNTLMAFCSSLFCTFKNNSCNYIDIIDKLASIGTNFLHIDNKDNTILHTICRNITIDNHNLVNVLLLHIINILGENVILIINNRNFFGYTALNYITLSNNRNCMKFLLQKSATITKYDEMFFEANPALQTIVDNVSIDSLVNALGNCKI